MSEQYPLTEALGMQVHSPKDVAVVVTDYVLAADLERELAELRERSERTSYLLGAAVADRKAAEQQLQAERERADTATKAMTAAHESLKWSNEYDAKILRERDAARAEVNHVAMTGAAVAKERDRLKAQCERLAGALEFAHTILTLTHPELADVEMNTLTTRQYMLWDRSAHSQALAEYKRERGE